MADGTRISGGNEDLRPDTLDAIRQILAVRQLPNAVSFDTPVVGTSELEEQQMRGLDATMENVPAQVIAPDKTVEFPDWQEKLRNLPKNPAIYETKFVRDQYYRFDTTITAVGTSAVVVLPNPIPNGKWAFLDEIHIAQISGAGSSPNGYLTDTGIAQLYAIVTPDGSTFGASYKSGRNIIPGNIIPQLTLNSLVAAANYLISVQYQIMTKIDLPELDLSQVFGIPKGSVSIEEDGMEASDVNRTDHREWPGGTTDFNGYEGV